MVKNTTGGSHFKKMSRKQGAAHFNYDALNDPNIINVSVIKALGDGRFYVANNKSEEIMMHIPGRFKGRNKHRNFVTVNSLVKVQLREYETSPVKTCELLQILQTTTTAQFFVSGTFAATPPAGIRGNELEDHIIFSHSEEPPVGATDDTTPQATLSIADLDAVNFDDI